MSVLQKTDTVARETFVNTVCFEIFQVERCYFGSPVKFPFIQNWISVRINDFFPRILGLRCLVLVFFNWQILKAMLGFWNLTPLIRTSSFTGSKGSISYDLFRNTSVSRR